MSATAIQELDIAAYKYLLAGGTIPGVVEKFHMPKSTIQRRVRSYVQGLSIPQQEEYSRARRYNKGSRWRGVVGPKLGQPCHQDRDHKGRFRSSRSRSRSRSPPRRKKSKSPPRRKKSRSPPSFTATMRKKADKKLAVAFDGYLANGELEEAQRLVDSLPEPLPGMAERL